MNYKLTVFGIWNILWRISVEVVGYNIGSALLSSETNNMHYTLSLHWAYSAMLHTMREHVQSFDIQQHDD